MLFFLFFFLLFSLFFCHPEIQFLILLKNTKSVFLEVLPALNTGFHGNQMERKNTGSGEFMLLPLGLLSDFLQSWAWGPELTFLAAPKQPTAA